MKAAIVEKPDILVVRDVPKPEVGEYDVLCELLYGAVCTGTDQHILYGTFPFPLNYPVVLGHESIGRTVQLGPKVRNIKEGDLITRVGTRPAADGSFDIAWGGFAEFGVAKDFRAMKEDGLPREQWDGSRVCQVLPKDTDPRAATMIITWRETLSYVTRMGVAKGTGLVVLGSGGNALSFAAHGKNLGADPVVVIGSPSRTDEAAAVGAAACLDYHAPDQELAEAGRKLCPCGFHFAIDVTGKKGQAERLLPLLRHGGMLGVYGLDDFFDVSLNPRRARGTFTFYNGHYDEEETHERVIEFFQKGALDAAVWLDFEHPFALDDINKAFDAAASRKMVKPLVRLATG